MKLTRSQHLLLAAGVFLLLNLTMGLLWVLSISFEWYLCWLIGLAMGVIWATYWIGLPRHISVEQEEEYLEEYEEEGLEEYEEEGLEEYEEEQPLVLARLPMLSEWHGAEFVICRIYGHKEFLSVLSRESIQYSYDRDLALRFTSLDRALRALAYCHNACGREYEFSAELWLPVCERVS